MKKLRRAMLLFVSVLALFGVTACSTGDSDDGSGTTSSSTTTTVTAEGNGSQIKWLGITSST